MTEYISRQGLRERLGIDPDGYCEKCRYLGMFGCNQSNEHLRACEAIDDEPAADVRHVVKCKDCKWWTKQEKSLQGRCALGGFYPTGEWFCANGENAEVYNGA